SGCGRAPGAGGELAGAEPAGRGSGAGRGGAAGAVPGGIVEACTLGPVGSGGRRCDGGVWVAGRGLSTCKGPDCCRD
ncbi:MAG: hypothetical protein OXR84_09575, partial [Magnetovibrio sp.]|nr:hypothetical protein [Magnetovibrio sp.]